ncbi:hypothetical protein B566_EDAN016631 [Ephemera danica]|nr:hypothetical protein B566_EDAN016631 [Ephemera danica]
MFSSVILVFLLGYSTSANNFIPEKNGYVLYCPCMGRFGNQADHFLGALGFAHGLNRTLVLPPWVEYRTGETKSVQVPFDAYFKVEPLKSFHRVITMENFMKNLAPKIWPPEKRISFCYMARTSLYNKDKKLAANETASCNAKEGNPFGPFWDTFGVDFVGSEMYAPLHYDVHHRNAAAEWHERYPPDKWPVLAFTGAPASFPLQLENRDLHRYLQWSDFIAKAAHNYIHTKLPNGAFVGIHLRNGMDWTRSLFAAPQCLGYSNEFGVATPAMCMPPREQVVRQLKHLMRARNYTAVFVASDNDHMLSELKSGLKHLKVSVHKLEPPNPHIELAVLGQANHFVGNCISSFSASVKRERDAKGLPSSFWAFPSERTIKAAQLHDEF